jgi:hypothetical protein
VPGSDYKTGRPQIAPSYPGSGSNPSNDREIDELEETSENRVVQAVQSVINALDVDERLDLLALTWLGRGDFSSFSEARCGAESLDEVNAASYLLGTPLVGDYFEENLSQPGHWLDDFQANRLR